MARTTKVHAGLYEMIDYCSKVQHDRKVEIERCDHFPGADKWQARATWDRFLYTDPLPTKRDAQRCAFHMIHNPEN